MRGCISASILGVSIRIRARILIYVVVRRRIRNLSVHIVRCTFRGHARSHSHNQTYNRKLDRIDKSTFSRKDNYRSSVRIVTITIMRVPCREMVLVAWRSAIAR